MRRRLTSILLLASLSLALSGNAWAANYSFRLEKETVNVYWQADGTASIDYVFVFANDAGALPIDYVDVGLPTTAYALNNISADVNDRPISDIQPSPYVKIGVALGLQQAAIAPGTTGTVHVLIRGIGQVLYPDDQDPTYASAVFSPTWFDPTLVHGQTDLTVIFHLPPGVQPAEPRYHVSTAPFPSQPEASLDDKGQVTYTWHAANANGSTQYMFGASFPTRYVPAFATAGRPTASPPSAPVAYSFQVKTESAIVAWHEDGTATVDCHLVVVNDAAAPPIDSLEVSLPGSDYSFAYAEVDGRPVASSRSPRAANGLVLQLGQSAIAPGATAAVRFYAFNFADMLQPDPQHPGYVLGMFTPTRFNPPNVHGPTDLTVTFRLPWALATTQVIVPTPVPPLTSRLGPTQGTTNFPEYTWHNAQADASAEYILRLSFPANVIVHPSPTPHGLLVDMKRGYGVGALADVCAVTLAVFAFMGLLVAITPTPPISPRRLEYLPPQITIEGNGIKRGLTAVEAAVLLERPLDTVLTMILFAVLKKGAARISSARPLVLEVTQPLPEDLNDYERDFLEAFQDKKAQWADDLKAAMVKLVKSVSEKMRGFSRTETVNYYQAIVEKAWQEVQAAATPEVKSQKFDELMDWALLDQDFVGRFGQAMGTGPMPVPVWWGHYAPLVHSTAPAISPASSPSASAAPARPSESVPALPGAEFAASIATGIQNFSAGVVGDVQHFTSQITDQTNPVPVSAGGGYHAGGGHCACACACAGCACACAGGGR